MELSQSIIVAEPAHQDKDYSKHTQEAIKGMVLGCFVQHGVDNLDLTLDEVVILLTPRINASKDQPLRSLVHGAMEELAAEEMLAVRTITQKVYITSDGLKFWKSQTERSDSLTKKTNAVWTHIKGKQEKGITVYAQKILDTEELNMHFLTQELLESILKALELKKLIVYQGWLCPIMVKV